VSGDLWRNGRKSPYYKAVRDLFANYTKWWRRQCRKDFFRERVTLTEGAIPGDFAATLTKGKCRVGIVGLNTAFLHFAEGKMRGRLAVSSHQFHKMCEDDGAAWAKQRHFCVLLTHHPSDWLHSRSGQEFHNEIFDPERFAFHLCGHMHEPFASRVATRARAARVSYRGSALYGRERCGGRRGVKRIHGYAGLTVRVRPGPVANLRVFSRVSMEQLGWEFVEDPGMCVERKSLLRGAEPIELTLREC